METREHYQSVITAEEEHLMNLIEEIRKLEQAADIARRSLDDSIADYRNNYPDDDFLVN